MYRTGVDINRTPSRSRRCARPPGPAHRYRFNVYVLDTPALGAPEGSSAALVRSMLRGHVLAHGTLTGTYGRP